MKKTVILWILSILITTAAAIYQRVTGPTYPVSGKVNLLNEEINYKFARSHGGTDDHIVIINTKNAEISGSLFYKRYKTNDDWKIVPMQFQSSEIIGSLPHQPPAGKLQYYVELKYKNEVKKIPADKPVTIRFKGDVPLYILIPHVLAMFIGMLLSTRTGLEFFNDGKNLKKLTVWTLVILFIGGLILGPIVQKFAFGEFWTGFPFGIDLTDNKTLITFLGWLIAYFMYSRSKKPKYWAAFGAILLILVYLIPHSVLGSELDYNKLDKENNSIQKIVE